MDSMPDEESLEAAGRQHHRSRPSGNKTRSRTEKEHDKVKESATESKSSSAEGSSQPRQFEEHVNVKSNAVGLTLRADQGHPRSRSFEHPQEARSDEHDLSTRSSVVDSFQEQSRSETQRLLQEGQKSFDDKSRSAAELTGPGGQRSTRRSTDKVSRQKSIEERSRRRSASDQRRASLDQERQRSIEEQSRSRPFVPTHCPIHTEDMMNIWCGSHNTVCCNTCVTLNHRSCGVSHLPAAARDVRTSLKYKNILLCHRKIIGQLKGLKQERLSNKEQLRSIHDTIQEKLTNDVALLDQAIASVETSLNEIEEDHESNDVEMFLKLRNSENVRKQGNGMLDNLHANLKTILSMVGMMAEMFNLEMPGYSSNQNEENGQSFTMGGVRGGVRVGAMGGAMGGASGLHGDVDDNGADRGEFDVKVTADKNTCNITSCCQMEDGMILITDKANKKLKRLGHDFKLYDFCDLPGCPETVVDVENRAAVAIGDKSLVQFVSCGEVLKLEHSFNVGKFCQGLAYRNGELYVGCYKGLSMGRVKIFMPDGTAIRECIAPTLWPCYLSVRPNNDEIYISDTLNGHVIAKNGDLLSTFFKFHSGSACPYGMCFGPIGQLFVCFQKKSRSSTNHIKRYMESDVSEQKQSADILKVDGLPQSVCYDKYNNKLLVTFEERDVVKVYTPSKKFLFQF